MYGLTGVLTGKLAGTVLAVRNGEQIARKYQPIVANPSTPAQVESRAKLKLLSQLSAVLGNIIAIPRVGAVSSRNMFTKVNYPLLTYTNDQADVNLNNIQITNSVVGMASVNAVRGADGIQVNLGSSPDVDRVVYVLLTKTPESKLRYISSRVVTSAGTGNPWAATFEAPGTECVILAYGVRFNDEGTRAKFGNLSAVSAEAFAKILVTSELGGSNVTMTETRGTTVAA